MKAFMLFTGSGPLVILTSHGSITEHRLVDKFRAKGIDKFIAHELPLSLARERYVSAYFLAEIHAGLGETDEAIRWLEHAYEDGDRAHFELDFAAWKSAFEKRMSFLQRHTVTITPLAT